MNQMFQFSFSTNGLCLSFVRLVTHTQYTQSCSTYPHRHTVICWIQIWKMWQSQGMVWNLACLIAFHCNNGIL